MGVLPARGRPRPPWLFLFLVTVSPAWLVAQLPEHQGLG